MEISLTPSVVSSFVYFSNNIFFIRQSREAYWYGFLFAMKIMLCARTARSPGCFWPDSDPSAVRVKMSMRRAKNIFMPKNVNCITIILSLKGNVRHKNNKIGCKQSNSRLPASCIYFVVLLITICLFKKQKKRKPFSKYKRKNEKTSLQITK